DTDFSFANIATGRIQERPRLSSPPTGVIRIPKCASHVLDTDGVASNRNSLSSPPATPALSLCPTESDIDGWTDIVTPEPTFLRPPSSSFIEETDPNSQGRSLTSIAHYATRVIFSKTIDLAIHRPSSFLTAFMLSIASRIVSGAVVY